MEAKKTGHASHDKVVEQMTPKKEGHNSQLMNERVQEIFDEFMKLEEDKKEITKHQRELKAKAKLEYGILSDVFAHEIRLKKKDSDVRIQFEQGHADLKGMLGYQMSMQFVVEPESGSNDVMGNVDPIEEARKKAKKK